MEQRSNRHVFKLQPRLPCWPILTFFLKLGLSHLFTTMNTNFPQIKHYLLWNIMDRLCYQILLLHFNTLFSLYRTAYNSAACLVILHFKQIFILPSGPKVLIQYDILIQMFQTSVKLSLSIFHDHWSLTNFPSCHFILILQSHVICTLSLK